MCDGVLLDRYFRWVLPVSHHSLEYHGNRRDQDCRQKHPKTVIELIDPAVELVDAVADPVFEVPYILSGRIASSHCFVHHRFAFNHSVRSSGSPVHAAAPVISATKSESSLSMA